MDEATNVFEIRPAVRKATPALIALWGESGTGKTYSALHLARGLVGPKGKIGLIDTENRRAEFYSQLVGGWDHLDLQPPFTPARYTAAMRAFEDRGDYGCIIVDSMSHVWVGEDGVLEMAERRGGNGINKWAAPKMAYQRMLNTLLRAPVHVIFCLRAKEKIVQEGTGKDAKIYSAGMVPIMEKTFIHEMTVAVRLCKGTHAPETMLDVKTTEDLAGAIAVGRAIGIETGQQIAAWVAGGEVIDHAAEKARKIARDMATLGTDRYKAHWEMLSRADKLALKPIQEELKALAATADAEAREERPTDNDEDPFGSPKSVQAAE
jgi:hypothetical protein